MFVTRSVGSAWSCSLACHVNGPPMRSSRCTRDATPSANAAGNVRDISGDASRHARSVACRSISTAISKPIDQAAASR
jgi:hypothetical protein